MFPALARAGLLLLSACPALLPAQDDVQDLLQRVQTMRAEGRHADVLPLIAVLQDRLREAGNLEAAVTLCSWSAAAHRALGAFAAEAAELQRGLDWLAASDMGAARRQRHVLALSVLQATALLHTGRLDQAVTAAHRAVAAAADQPAAAGAMAHNCLGRVLVAAGRPAAAAMACRSALHLLPADDPQQRSVRHNLALAELHLGQSETALQAFTAHAAGQGPGAAAARAGQAAALILLERFAEALPVLDALIAAPDTGTSDGLLLRVERARCLRALGRAADALRETRAVLAAMPAVLPEASPLRDAILRGHGSALRLAGETSDSAELLAEARRTFEAALAFADGLGLPDAAWDRIKLALLLKDHFPGEEEAALALLQRATLDLEARRSQATELDASERAGLFRRLRAAEFRHLDPYDNGARLLLRLGRTEAALAMVERGRARALLDLVQRGGDGTAATSAAGTPRDPAAIRAMLRPGERMLVYLLGEPDSFVFVVPPPGEALRALPLTDAAGRPFGMAAVARAVQALRHAIGGAARTTPTRGEPVDDVAPAPFGKVAHGLFQALLPGELWSEIEAAPLVHVVPHGALHLLPFEALVVQPHADAARCRCWLDDGPPIAYGPSGSVLAWSGERRAAQLLAPRPRGVVVLAAPRFTEPDRSAPPPNAGLTVRALEPTGAAARAGLRVGDVLVALDAAPLRDLAALRAMTDASDPHVLQVWRAGREFAVRIAPRELDGSCDEGPPAAALAALPAGSPAARADAAATARLLPLPGAAREAEAIATAWQERAPCEVRLGDDAHETALRALAAEARILHLASHQVHDPGSPWSAGRVALCPPWVPTAGDDGFLTIDDLLGDNAPDLRACQLVVLSSCRSLLGRLGDDEGLFGLPWGCLHAGCPAVLASQWPVDDDATAILMAGFHRRLAAGDAGEPLLALQESLRDLRRQRPQPLHWAPFLWIGSPR